MRSLIVTAVAFVALAAASAPVDHNAQFAEFKSKYNRQYTSIAEEASRRAIFETNMRRAAQLEKENPKATFGASMYADIDAAEFKSTHHNADFTKHIANRKPADLSALAKGGKSIDWVSKGAVTHVKNQLNCGGCWSFSTTGNIEGQWFLAGHSLTSLSEQELLSCDTETGNSGCKGGLMDYAFEWLTEYKNGDIDTAASYPFVDGQSGVTSKCHASGKTVGATISGHLDLPTNEDKIADFVYANGPASIGVDATSFQTYTGGILTNCQDVQLDHAVLIVGYDDTNSPPYWTIKNSWSATWGENGYIRVQKGTDQCGLKKASSSSTVTKSGTIAPAGPNPPTSPPSPPSPPSPTSAPSSGGSFTQKICTSSTCTSGCQSHTFPQNTCLSLQGGGSATASCSSAGLTMTEYPQSSDCSGFSIPSTQPVNQCVQDTQGSYLENVCSSSQGSVMAQFRKVQ